MLDKKPSNKLTSNFL